MYFNTRTNKKERISRIFQMHANKQNQIDSLQAGDIAALVGFKDIRTGDTLCVRKCSYCFRIYGFPRSSNWNYTQSQKLKKIWIN